MKRLFLSTALTLFLILNMSAQQTLTLTIVETHKDGEVSVSFDDGEYENDAIDKLDDDDLDMGWEGEDLNIMTSFTRFQNVTIPKGAVIESAILTIYAHEDEADDAYINVYAEAADNSAAFVETETLADRTWTTSMVDWDCTDPWTMWQPYNSPELKTLIQEVIDRDGWQSGNALTLFMQGEDQGASLLDNARDFESFENIEDPEDGGDGKHHPERIPTLKITYTVPAQIVSFTIIETHKDGEVSVSFDDGEYENDAIDKLDDDDLDMGWEGEDLNIMTSFTRFQNVTIPKGAVIESAILTIYAHEDEADDAYINVYAEAADNSAAFVETETMADRTWTTSMVDWDCTDPWTMWQPYNSPELKTVVQEVIDRDGWQSGNALTLFMQGEDQGASLLDNARDFESFENIEDPEDGGDGKHHPERIPVLTVTYTTGGISGISKVESNGFKVFPNPSNGYVNLVLDNKIAAEISVYTVSGLLLKSIQPTSYNQEINLSDLNAGIYLIKVRTSEQTMVQKLKIQ